jgi:hypothetical protein
VKLPPQEKTLLTEANPRSTMVFQGVVISHVTLQNIVIFFLLYWMSLIFYPSSADVNYNFHNFQTFTKRLCQYLYYILFTQIFRRLTPSPCLTLNLNTALTRSWLGTKNVGFTCRLSLNSHRGFAKFQKNHLKIFTDHLSFHNSFDNFSVWVDYSFLSNDVLTCMPIIS